MMQWKCSEQSGGDDEDDKIGEEGASYALPYVLLYSRTVIGYWLSVYILFVTVHEVE